MIVSASIRTDIPALYGDWFMRRFAAGWCMVANPYGGKPYRVSLREGIDGYVFWTRHGAPFLPALALLRDAGLPFVVQYTLTGYPRWLEPAVPDTRRAIQTMLRVAERFGPRVVVWRYDPIVMTTAMPPAWHLANFALIAGKLEGAVDEVVTSFVEPYAKTRRNMERLAGASGHPWTIPSPGEKRELAGRMRDIAAGFKMRLSLCAQPELTGEGSPGPAACVDATRLSDIAGHPIAAKRKANRKGCLCAEARDIGEYQSCSQGCAYCYAVASREAALARRRAHDPDGEFLFAPAARNAG